MPLRIERNLARQLGHEFRALGPRPDEAHVADQHVPELRQLVEPAAAQEPADGVTRGSPCFDAQTGPVSASASCRIERNLWTVKTRPCCPTRRCGYSAGPGDVSFDRDRDNR